MDKINLDEGYTFGMGVFETIAVNQGNPILLDQHLNRLKDSLSFLNMDPSKHENLLHEKSIMAYLENHSMEFGVLKIMASEENMVFTLRKNLYTPHDFEKGFSVDISEVLRNETSPFTYIKSFNYGDNILEKRMAKKRGIDEPLFLNTKGQLTEGATTNLFLIKDEVLYTPKLECGLLKGIIRSYIIEHYPVVETMIYPEEVPNYQEMFLTNSLLGIMPVKKFKDHVFENRKYTKRILEEYGLFSSWNMI